MSRSTPCSEYAEYVVQLTVLHVLLGCPTYYYQYIPAALLVRAATQGDGRSPEESDPSSSWSVGCYLLPFIHHVLLMS